MPPQTTRPPFFTARSAAGTSDPTGAKMMAASSEFRRPVVGATGPDRAERAREVLRRGVTGAREGVDAASLPGRNLGQDMGGGAEAVEAERNPLPGHAVTAPADQTGAHERRRFRGIERLIKRKTKARVGHRMGRIAAVAGIAGKHWRIAQILAPGAAIRTGAICAAEPRHTDALAEREAGHARSDRRDTADNFVSRDDRQLRVRQVAVDHMQIGAAHPASGDLDQDFAAGRLRDRPLAQNQRCVRPIQNHRAHG